MPGRQRNLEVKAIDPDPHATLAAALELGAEDQGVVHQRDTYFHAVVGRLKLREAPPRPAELIAYDRAELEGPKVSLYRVVQVADPGGRGQTALEDDLVGVDVADAANDLLIE